MDIEGSAVAGAACAQLLAGEVEGGRLVATHDPPRHRRPPDHGPARVRWSASTRKRGGYRVARRSARAPMGSRSCPMPRPGRSSSRGRGARLSRPPLRRADGACAHRHRHGTLPRSPAISTLHLRPIGAGSTPYGGSAMARPRVPAVVAGVLAGILLPTMASPVLGREKPVDGADPGTRSERLRCRSGLPLRHRVVLSRQGIPRPNHVSGPAERRPADPPDAGVVNTKVTNLGKSRTYVTASVQDFVSRPTGPSMSRSTGGSPSPTSRPTSADRRCTCSPATCMTSSTAPSR